MTKVYRINIQASKRTILPLRLLNVLDDNRVIFEVFDSPTAARRRLNGLIADWHHERTRDFLQRLREDSRIAYEGVTVEEVDVQS